MRIPSLNLISLLVEGKSVVIKFKSMIRKNSGFLYRLKLISSNK